ncbi:nicotinamide-nucleotide amidohydrolase family protein [Pseudoalteromonas rubra]|uniref:Nicotinamide-nucleotide amidohydrolase family protein n=1 Tax=Pseudoalteromonas rubra TaxID=43658 RepID=A0A5S3V5Y0_9GAMM|nr:nicotinamide-nucleotide amidohydrolase family protein [Pseudoalteromonas rubra]QPB82008.1 nicotinamide-nucleotide amidohydrolase family protein [Pseudoalteromonas rubra]
MELHTEIASLAAQLGAILTNNRQTITTAESCTGGGISYALTDTPGSSAYIERCFVTYSNEAKSQLLGVTPNTLAEFGAVSQQTVQEMVQGAANAARADVAIAVSGIAGPGGGSLEKPVGTVWFGFYLQDKVLCEVCHFTGTRAEVRVQAIEFSIRKIISLLNG